MNFLSSPSILRCLLACALAFPAALHAQSISNPSFEFDTNFINGSGYAFENGLISGWTYSNASRVGLNSAGLSPFADNGTIPHGSNVAFIKSSNDQVTTLSTTILGLTPGKSYVVRFRANASSSGTTTPSPKIALNGGTPVLFAADPAVGGTNPYHSVSADFTATAATAALVISNQTAQSSTVLVDDFSITEAFTVAAWTNDASSGIDSADTYWAYHFGTTDQATVAGVAVPGIAGFNPSNPSLSITGMTDEHSDTNNLTTLGGSGSALIARNFIYGGNPATITLKQLSPGLAYTASILSVGWEAGSRSVTFASSSGSQVVNQDQFGDNNGIRVDQTFTATAATHEITLTPGSSATWHLYGISLRALSPEAFSPQVTNTNDDGPGSLRWAIAGALPGVTITFNPTVFDGSASATITLGGTQLTIDKNLTIDASALDAGITINANGGSRVLEVKPGNTVVLNSLTLTGGLATGATNIGGGIYCKDATLTLDRCTISGNSATIQCGGFFQNGGTSTITNSTISANTTPNNGGGLYILGSGVCNLTHCTISGNSSTNNGGGGGIMTYTGAQVNVVQTTIANNSTGTGTGGGIRQGLNDVIIHLENSIVAGNTSSTGSDIIGAVATHSGVNFIGITTGASGLGTENTHYLTGDPMLAALGDNGGSTQTMLPLEDSPVIDASNTPDPGGTDQRGFPRFLDGKGNGSVALDIGSVEVPSSVVANGEDSGPGSLRQLVADVVNGTTITFDPVALDGTTITLASQISVAAGRNVTIDASALTGGITLASDGTDRLFTVEAGANLTLQSLTLTGGRTSENGGAINNNGTLTLNDCTLSGNHSNTSGGAIFNSAATLFLNRCTLADNSASQGGAIYSQGNLLLDQCTLSGNAATSAGGGISSDGSASVGDPVLQLQNTILAGNTAPTGPDLQDAANTKFLLGKNLISTIAGSTLEVADTKLIIDPNPRLSPLGDYGGPTQTMIPLAGSLAIDAAGTTAQTTDQRGFPRFVGTAPDIGAVELGPITLVNYPIDQNGTDDEMSLREAIAVATGPGAVIHFDPTVFGGQPADKITLASGQLTIARSVTIDASNITGGITIDADGANNGHRVLEIAPGNTVSLHFLTLTRGRVSGDPDDQKANEGGAIYNDLATLTLDSCTLSGNFAEYSGGGIYSHSESGSATLTLSACTLSGNSSALGGGIYSSGFQGSATLSLSACTLSDNSASEGGGGIVQNGYKGSAFLSLSACTLSGNSAYYAGGVDSDSPNTIQILNNTILAGNTASIGPNILGSFSGTNNLISGDPKLAPLGDYGGSTQTMIPLAGSLAIDTAGATVQTTDQRGFPRSVGSAPDIGAVEYQPVTDLARFWLTDFDLDGSPYGAELALGTDPAVSDAGNSRHLTAPVFDANGFASLSFGRNLGAPAGTGWKLMRSTTLAQGSFIQIYSFNGAGTFDAEKITANETLTDSFTVTDKDPPAGTAVYRFEADFTAE